MTLTAMMTVGEQVKACQLVALAVTSTERNPVFKDIPTFAEQGYPDVAGVLGPGCLERRPSAEVVDRLGGAARA